MTAPTQAQIEAARTCLISAQFHAQWIPDAWIRDSFIKDCEKSVAVLTAAAEVEPDLEANRLYRYLNGLDQDSHDKRAEHIMQQTLDSLMVGPTNRNSTKEVLANHFEAVEAATIERCAKVAANWEHDHYGTGKGIAAAIRALKTGKNHA